MKIKTVYRTYFSKRKNKFITKKYTYDPRKYIKRRRGRKSLVTKSGKIYQERIDEFLESLNFTNKNKAKEIIKDFKLNHRRLTDQALKSLLSRDKREKMLINAGLTLDEGLEELGVSEEEYFDDENWDGSKFKANGDEYEFQFNYYGDVWIKQ